MNCNFILKSLNGVKLFTVIVNWICQNIYNACRCRCRATYADTLAAERQSERTVCRATANAALRFAYEWKPQNRNGGANETMIT